MAENNNINIQTFDVSIEKFFKSWLLILEPFLKLRNKEIDLLAKLLYHRYLISLEVKNKEMLDDLLFSSKIKKLICDELNMKDYDYSNLLTCLRKKKLIIGRSLNKQIVPVIQEPFTNFKLVYNMNIVNGK